MPESTEKEKSTFAEAPEKEVEVKETVIPEVEEVEEDTEPTVKVALTEDYDGPTPVFVSVCDADGREFRTEVTKGADVPEALAEAVTAAAFIEVTE